MKKNILYPLLFMLAGNICLAQSRQPDPLPAAPAPAAAPSETATVASEKAPVLKTPETTTSPHQTETPHSAGETPPSGGAPAQTPLKAPAQQEEKPPIRESQKKEESVPVKKDMDTVGTKNQPSPVDARKAAMERRSKQARILANLAIDLMAHGNDALAEKKLHEALQIDPNLASAYCNLALFDWRAGNPEAAFMNIETCFMKGFRDFTNIEEDADFGNIISDRRYDALKRRYR